MSSRRLAVVNPLLHQAVVSETDELDKQSGKHTELSTSCTRTCVSTNVTQPNPKTQTVFNANESVTCGTNHAEVLTSIAVHANRDTGVAEEKHGPCDHPAQPSFINTERSLSATCGVTALSNSRRLRSGEQSPALISRDPVRPGHSTGMEPVNASPLVTRSAGHASDRTMDTGLSAEPIKPEKLDPNRTRMVQAIHDFHDPCTPNALSFHKGDLLTIFCTPSAPSLDSHATYRGFLTARGPQPVGLVPGWAITLVPVSKPMSSITQVTRTKVDFAVQTDFPEDLGDEYFSDTDESCSSEAEPDNPADRERNPVQLIPPASARSHLMSSSVELKPTRHSGPGSSPAHTASMMTMMMKLHKSPISSNDSVGLRSGITAGSATVQTMTPAWDSNKRHSAASLDSGRDSTYAGSSEGSGGTQSTNPQSGGMLRSPQPSFDRTPLNLTSSPGKLDAQQEHSATVMHCSYPGNVYTRTSTLVTSRTPLGAHSPAGGESTHSYTQAEGSLSISSADSLTDGSPRFTFPYSCSSLPSAAASVQPLLPAIHHRPSGPVIRRAFATDHSYGQFVPSPPGMLPMEYRSPHPVFHSPHPAGHTKRFVYHRPVDCFELAARRPELNRDPLSQWLHSIGLSRLEETLSTAGFDLWTLCRTTPEELNACGITNPADRQLLRMELNRLQLHEPIPDHLPAKVYDWLAELNLAAYWPFFREQKICTFEQIAKLTWEDMEEVGISKLGHQKKLMLAIGRLTRQIAASNSTNSNQPQLAASAYTMTGQDSTGGFVTHPISAPGYSSSHCSTASISSPAVMHEADSISSLVPSSLISADTSSSNPTGCLSIATPSVLEELAESENLSESPPFPSPPPAFQDPPIPLESEGNVDHSSSSPVCNNPTSLAISTSLATGTISLPPPVPLRRSSINELDGTMQNTNAVQSDWDTAGHTTKSSLRVRYPRLARRVQSIVSSHAQIPDSGESVQGWNNLTRRSSSPSLFPLKPDALAAKESLTKWSSGQLATPQLCFPSNFEAPLDPELQDMTDIRAMLDALSEHLTSATQL